MEKDLKELFEEPGSPRKIEDFATPLPVLMCRPPMPSAHGRRRGSQNNARKSKDCGEAHAGVAFEWADTKQT